MWFLQNILKESNVSKSKQLQQLLCRYWNEFSPLFPKVPQQPITALQPRHLLALLQPFLTWTRFPGLLQIPTWANHSSSFAKVSVSSSSFRLWQCSAFTGELQKAAHSDILFQQPCFQCFVFHLVQLQEQHHPAVSLQIFFFSSPPVSLIFQCVSSN